MMEENQNSDLILRENSMSTIFDKIPSKRKLIRDTKNIQVSFGRVRTKLMGPRKYSNPVHKDKFDMYELQDDMLEQSHRIRLLE